MIVEAEASADVPYSICELIVSMVTLAEYYVCSGESRSRLLFTMFQMGPRIKNQEQVIP